MTDGQGAGRRREPTQPYVSKDDAADAPSAPAVPAASADVEAMEAAAVQTDPAVARLGTTMGERYALEAVLGDGGMATVYGAHDTQLGRDVAVKVLHEGVAHDAELRARFEREARVLAALSHPHIVSLLDFGVADGSPYLVMELLRGRPLGDELADGARLSWDRAVALIQQIVGALIYAHGEGFLHRDLKPDNVFLTQLDTLGDHAQILDFGFAKFVDRQRAGAQLTTPDRLFGTPRYLAPEQLAGDEADVRADLYAVGVIFFQMLAGCRPFEGTIREVLAAKMVHDPPRLSEAAPVAATSDALEAFLARAIARDRDDRFPDGRAFLEALAALEPPTVRPLQSNPAQPTPAEPTPGSTSAKAVEPRAAAPLSEHRAAIALLVGLGALALLSLFGSLIGPEPDDGLRRELSKKPPPRAEHAERAEQGRAPSDPWAGVTLAPAVATARTYALMGEEMEGEALRDLREHARAHPEDMHAQLLLGHVFATRHMRAMAVSAYERALLLDLDAADDPQLAVDLVALATEEGVGPGPRRVLARYLPERARRVVARALDDPDLDPRRRARLERLADALETPGAAR